MSAPSRATRPPALPLVMAGTTLVLWASAFVAIRHLQDVPPGALALGRTAVGTVVLALFLLVRRTRTHRPMVVPRGRDWLPVVTVGVLWFGVYMVALNAAEQRIDAGTASMLVQISPIVIAVLAVLFLGERPHRGLFIGLAVAFTGVVLIGFATSSGDGRGDLLGVLLVLLAAVVYSVSVITQKPVLARVPALDMTFFACLIGTVACLPFSGQLVSVIDTAPAGNLWWIVYLGVFPTAVAFTTWAVALTAMSASSLGVTTYLVPLITVLLAWLLLSETPPWLAFVGGVLSLVGVGIARRRPRVEPALRSHADNASHPPPMRRGRPGR